MATDAEVEKVKQRIANKKAKLAEHESKTAAKVHEDSNDARLARLQAEEARVDAELVAAKLLKPSQAHEAPEGSPVDVPGPQVAATGLARKEK